MFNVSDHVICIDGEPRSAFGGPQPKPGMQYVIEDVWCDALSHEGYLVHLVGFAERTHPMTGHRMGFTPSRFRKLSEVQAENRLKALVGNMQENTATP